jgi:hypothetical protein
VSKNAIKKEKEILHFAHPLIKIPFKGKAGLV